MDNKIIQLCNEIDKDGRISEYLDKRHLLDQDADIYYTGEWLHLVSYALSYEWWEGEDSDDEHSFDRELFGRDFKLFKLTYSVAQRLLLTMDHVFYQIWPQITTVTWLETEIEDFTTAKLKNTSITCACGD